MTYGIPKMDLCGATLFMINNSDLLRLQARVTYDLVATEVILILWKYFVNTSTIYDDFVKAKSKQAYYQGLLFNHLTHTVLWYVFVPKWKYQSNIYLILFSQCITV